MRVEKGGLYLHESIGPLLIRSIQCAFDFIRCLHFTQLKSEAQRLGRDFGFHNAAPDVFAPVRKRDYAKSFRHILLNQSQAVAVYLWVHIVDASDIPARMGETGNKA